MPKHKNPNFFIARFLELKWLFVVLFLLIMAMYTGGNEQGYYNWPGDFFASLKMATTTCGVVYIAYLIYWWRGTLDVLLMWVFRVGHTAKDYRFALKQAQQKEYPNNDFIKLLSIRPGWFYLHLPKTNWLWYQIADFRLALAGLAKINVKPLAIKHRLPLSSRRFTDLLFLIHYLNEHWQEDGSSNANLLEKLRYKRLYYTQLKYEIASYCQLSDKKRKTTKERKFLKLYKSMYLGRYDRLMQDEGEDWVH
jgi:hypothetical protein